MLHRINGNSLTDSCNFYSDGAKIQKGEKKARKVLAKLGMKNLQGTTRVTLRKKDGYIFVINNPTVMRSGEDGNSFAVFGEIQIDDPNARMQMQKAQEMAAQAKAAAAATGAAAKDATPKDSGAGDGEAVDETGVSAEHIGMVMEHVQCSRAEAVKALKENNNDMVSAVMSLTK